MNYTRNFGPTPFDWLMIALSFVIIAGIVIPR